MVLMAATVAGDGANERGRIPAEVVAAGRKMIDGYFHVLRGKWDTSVVVLLAGGDFVAVLDESLFDILPIPFIGICEFCLGLVQTDVCLDLIIDLVGLTLDQELNQTIILDGDVIVTHAHSGSPTLKLLVDLVHEGKFLGGQMVVRMTTIAIHPTKVRDQSAR